MKTLATTVCILVIASSFASAVTSLSTPHEKTPNEVKKVDNPAETSVSQGDTKIRLLASDTSGLTLEIRVTENDLNIKEVTVAGKLFHMITLADCVSSTDEIGGPQLPLATQIVALPESVEVTLEVLYSAFSTKRDITVYPVPEPVKTKTPDGFTYFDEQFYVDEKAYSTDAFQPGPLAQISGISYLRDVRVAQLTFYPVQYNPVTQELRVYSSIKARVNYNVPAKLEIHDAGPLTNILEHSVLNYESNQTPVLSLGRDGQTPGTVTYPSDFSSHDNAADYLIITSDQFYYPALQDFENGTLANQLNALAQWRAAYNGFDVAVVTVNNPFIGGNSDTTIKAFIDYVYHNWSAPHMSDNHVGYILLVGDTLDVDTHYQDGTCGLCVSDRWYGCIGDDLLPDIMIGRFSVDTSTELEVIAEKTIHYEQNPVEGDWHKKVLLCEGSLGNFPEYPFVKETLLKNGGYGVYEVVKQDGGTSSDVVTNISEGRVIVTYCGHGTRIEWDPGWPSLFQYNNIFQLTNGYKLPVIFSLACDTGMFQNKLNCLGEGFLNTPGKGGIAFWGASSVTSSSSFRYATYAFMSIFKHFEYIVGRIIYDAIIQTYGAYPEYNLLGDPALDISGSTGYPDKLDLAISYWNITATPDSVHEKVFVNATIQNIGGGPAIDVPVRFFYVTPDGSWCFIGEHSIPEILPGGLETVSQIWNVTGRSGAIIVKIDPDDVIDEAFELNNQAGIAIELPTIRGIEYSICTDPTSQSSPALYDNIVVWEDYRNGNWDIYGYNLSNFTEFPICIESHPQYEPAIHGHTVIWFDYRNGNWDIYGYDLSNSTEFPICTEPHDQFDPAIHGHTVIWIDYRNGNSDIYGYDLLTSTNLTIWTEPHDQFDPAIYGNTIVWQDGNDIYGYDLCTSTYFTICNETGSQFSPAIYGDTVIWIDQQSGTWSVCGYNLVTSIGFTLCTESWIQSHPVIYDNIVLWEDRESGNQNIRGYDLIFSTSFTLGTALNDQPRYPAIDGKHIVWSDTRNGNEDIYGFTIYEPQSPSGLTATTTGRTVLLEWNPNPEWDLTGYRIYRNSTGSSTVFETIAEVNNNTATYCDTDLTYYTTYSYKISAFTIVEGDFSEVVNATINELPHCGDANNDGTIDVTDVVYLINYLFIGGFEPMPMLCVGDANGDGKVNVNDVVYLINYLFMGGPPPGGCCKN